MFVEQALKNVDHRHRPCRADLMKLAQVDPYAEPHAFIHQSAQRRNQTSNPNRSAICPNQRQIPAKPPRVAEEGN